MINSNYYGVVSIYFTTQTDTSFFVCTFDTCGHPLITHNIEYTDY